jgi:hypothetical protein
MIDQLIGPVTGLLDKFIEDKDQKARLAHDVATMAQKHAQELAKGQLEINKTEAQHRSVWVAGWRPAIGWSCAAGFFYTFLGYPILTWLGSMFGVMELPQINTDILLELTFAMLGMAGLRTFEKMRGVTQ